MTGSAAITRTSIAAAPVASLMSPENAPRPAGAKSALMADAKDSWPSRSHPSETGTKDAAAPNNMTSSATVCQCWRNRSFSFRPAGETIRTSEFILNGKR